ncbi:MAG: hypothetical protein Q7T81_14805 [Pseudolabrys sp.]|nr:hypothetical protein [Pseudolabrys sp.]
MPEIDELIVSARQSYRLASEARGAKEMRRFASMAEEYLVMADEQLAAAIPRHTSTWSLP